ncbi:pre-rRNA-processing protein pno1 [Parelaphostrongylus tenuis]|uniref:Pre-rRNA-processing protein pno1 n=1 Tax=Parelaphostrongylus tenuis TaxID=148309 RepID=A0AAD5QZX5_PARTN|nr:pre-rRNA-processing protein pno1 [Parelaphostrongylus tenuis]
MEGVDDMPDLIDVDLPTQLPSLVQQNIKAKETEEFQTVSRRKRKATVENVEMEECSDAVAGQHAQRCEDTLSHRSKRSKGEKGEIRKIPVPKHRYTPLKDNWVNIFTPIVKNLGLQVRFNMKSRNVEIRNPKDKEETTDLQKVRSLSQDLKVIPLIRLDHLFLETFEIADVKSSLKGDNLSRAVGRIAGKDGRTKLVIENVTKTRIVLADTKIHLLGAYQNLKLARNAVCSLILGAPPSKVYGNLRNLASRSSERL